MDDVVRFGKVEEHDEPVGAVWLKDWNLRHAIAAAFQKKGITISEEEVSRIVRDTPHTMAVKVNFYREKYIGIQNGQKSSHTDPDYFLWVYQTHTGAAPITNWRVKRNQDMDQAREVPGIGKDDLSEFNGGSRTLQGDHSQDLGKTIGADHDDIGPLAVTS